MKRRNSAIIIALAAVAMLAAGCKKEQTGKTVTLGASMASNNTKVYIDGYTPKWNEGDQVNVNGTAYTVSNISGGTADIPGVADASDFRCVYPSSIVTSGLAAESGTCNVTLPTTQTYAVDNSGNQTVAVPMSGMTIGTNVTFHNLCSVLKVTFKNSTGSSQTLRRIRVTAASAYLSGSGTAQVTGNDNDKVTLVSGRKYVDLDISSGETVTAGENKEFYIVLPEFSESQDVTITFYNNSNEEASVNVSSVSVGHNRLISKTINVNTFTSAPVNAVNGLFTINPNGDQVYFSKGNLRATGTTSSTNGSGWTWSFADHQYDRVGSATANTSIKGNGTLSSAGTVDLFGWSTSATYYGIHKSTDADDYSGDFVDWGTAYNSANGTSGWRTLSNAEWIYLLNTRGTVNGWACYAKVKINVNSGVEGLIIFPDGVNITGSTATLAGVTFNNANQSGESGYSKTISGSEWNDLEAAGCVFLPAAGERDGTTVLYVGDYGGYWSSSRVYSRVNIVDFNDYSGLKVGDERDSRDNGHSVRLVQNK